MVAPEAEKPLKVVEICAGAGGQALGLMQAGFEHELAIELDPTAANTLRVNLRAWHGDPERPELFVTKRGGGKKVPLPPAPVEIVDRVITGDVASKKVWDKAHSANLALPEHFDLLAGGVPCPPFSLAGQQHGSADERDLFAWAVHQCQILKPRALLLENVRGLSMPRFSAYRQEILDQLIDMKYVAEWRLLQASDFGVPQLRPRFVLVALQEEFAPYFHWPKKAQGKPRTVGETLKDLMGARGWKGLDKWVEKANGIAPTIVGGSKKHGGADLGPTRAKKAWEQLGVDAWGIANEAPAEDEEFEVGPKLTTEMVQLLQGWQPSEWQFVGMKTSRYRQVGNAFPPPVAKAVGLAIKSALLKKGDPVDRDVDTEHDPIYRALRDAGDFLTAAQISKAIGKELEAHELEHRISLLNKDFEVEIDDSKPSVAKFKLGKFKAFVGQEDHVRHDLFSKNKSKIS